MSISFARVAGTSTTFAATNAYTAVTPGATSSSTATGGGGLTGQDVTDYYLLHVFTKPYLDAHTLSWPSFRYSYYFWFGFVPVFLIWTIMHQLHWRMGALGALFRKFGMRKITLGGGVAAVKDAENGQVKRRRGWSSPTLAQIFGFLVFVAFCFCLSYIGPDYIEPRTCLFGSAECGYHPVNGDNATNQFGRRVKRAFEAVGVTSSHLMKRRPVRAGWSPLTDSLLSGPNYQIDKSLWTSSSRVGLITYAILPLSVSLALKQWPMNLFATPFLTNLSFDKTAWWHKWIGRLIWAMSTVHTGLWTKQLFVDQNPFNEPTFYTSWKWHRLLAGGISYGFLTAMVAFSLKPLRQRYYEIFYYSHVALVLGFLVTIIIHYQALQGWCLLATCLWGLERIVRFCIFLGLNYGPGLPVFGEGAAGKAQFTSRGAREGGFKVNNVEKRLSVENKAAQAAPYGNEEWSAASRSTQNLHEMPAPVSMRRPVYEYGVGNDVARNDSHPLPYGAIPFEHGSPVASRHLLSSPAQSYHEKYSGSTTPTPSRPLHRMQPIPRGYALAQILPGRVIKLTVHTPRHLNWRPGQYIMLTIPSAQWWQCHPYTIANAQSATEGLLAVKPDGEERSGSEMTFLISTRRGFTKKLYKSIVQKRKRLTGGGSTAYTGGDGQGAAGNGASGVLIRAQTYLPSGSAARAHWDDHSTVVLIAAGTGVTYTLAVLEHLCYGMFAKAAAAKGEEPSWAGGRAKRKGKPTNVVRVRFIWLLREYAHLAWIAPALRRCLDISDPARLRVDLFVTRELKQVHNMPYSQGEGKAAGTDDDIFRPPAPVFARTHGRSHSMDSNVSDSSETVVEQPHQHGVHNTKRFTHSDGVAVHDSAADFSVTDMILFDGEEEEPTAADEEISTKIKKEGKLRRALSRKASKKTKGTDQRNGSANTLQPPSRAGYHNDVDLSGDESGTSTPRKTPPSHQYPPPSSGFNTPGMSRRGSGYSDFRQSEDQQSFYSGKRNSAPGAPLLAEDEVASLDMDEYDRVDLDAIAELARGGRPDLEAMLDDEIERSQGSIAVGCCGPPSLNNLVRAMVAKRISPGRMAKGDQRGNVELISEEFEI